jgi:N utilization substance protein A
MELPGVSSELVESLIEQGFLSYEDIAVLTPAELCDMGGMDEDTASEMIAFADQEAERAEREPKPPKQRESTSQSGSHPAPPVVIPSTAAERFDSLFAPEPAAGPEGEVVGELPPAGEGLGEEVYTEVEGDIEEPFSETGEGEVALPPVEEEAHESMPAGEEAEEKGPAPAPAGEAVQESTTGG